MQQIIIALLTLMWGLAPALAQTTSGGIEVKDVWARIASGQTSLFLTIVNHTATDDALLSATSPAADKLSLQKMSVKNLKAKRKDLEAVRVPAMSATRLHPGAEYIAVEGMHEPLRPGIALPVTLVFRRAGQIETTAIVNNQELGNRGR